MLAKETKMNMKMKLVGNEDEGADFPL